MDSTKLETVKIVMLKGEKGDAGVSYDDTGVRNLITAEAQERASADNGLEMQKADKTEVNSLADRLDTEINGINTEIDVLDARMDTFASLPSGSTSGNAELVDIRVGVDGTTYPSAGDAVRGQVNELKDNWDVAKENIRFNSIAPYLHKKNTYVNGSFVEAAQNGYDLYKIPCKAGEFAIVEYTGDSVPYDGMNLYAFWCIEKTDGTYSRDYYNNAKVLRVIETIKTIVFVAPEDCKNICFCFKHDRVGDVSIYRNYPNPSFADFRQKSIVKIDNNVALNTRIFFNTTQIDYFNNNPNYAIWQMPIKKGDRIRFKSSTLPSMSFVASVIYTDSTVVRINEVSEYVFTDDGILSSFDYVPDGSNATLIPKEQFKISASNVDGLDLDTTPILDGKFWCSFGDSIVYQNKWQPLIVDALGGTHQNCGIGSTPVGGSDANAFWQAVRLNAVKDTNADIVTILGGANDLALNVPVGTDANLSDKDTSTFIGAYSYIIDNLLTWKPSLKIVILTTTYAHNNGTDISQSLTYDMYADASKKVAEYYHLPCVDLYEQSGFNQYTMGASPYNIYSADHIHPNDAGAKIIASMVMAKFKEIMSVN